DDFIDQVVQMGRSIEELGFEILLNQADGRAGKDRVVGNDPQQIQSLTLEAASDEVGHIIDLAENNFIEDDPNDFNAFTVEERLIQSDFIDGFADAASRNQD